jgi:hypothetical protein
VSARVRLALLGVLLVALAVAEVPVRTPAQAEAAGPAPVVTSPSAGDLVSSDATFTATSDSPYVLFELESNGRVARGTPVALSADGVFRDVLPTVGLGSFSVRARACSDADPVSCTVAGEYVSVRGLHARLTSAEAWPSVLDPTVLGRVSLRATDLGGYPAMVTGLPGVASGQVDDGEVVEVDLSSVADGDYEVWVRQCNPLNTFICTNRGWRWRVRRAPYLEASGPALLVSQNGDGFWETAVTRVVLDEDVSVTARWRITSRGATVAGPYEFSPEAISQARSSGGTAIEVDPRAKLGHPLPAGEYRLEVEATANEPDFTKSKRVSVPLHVSNAAPVTKLTPNARVVYPDDSHPGVAHGLRISPRLDVREARYGGMGYRILKGDGQPLGGAGSWYLVDPDNPVITWDGRYYRNGGGALVPAPEGAYRVELIRFPVGGPPGVYGPVSAPFTLSRLQRREVERVVVKTARASRLRTLAPRGARVRVGGRGSLRFERLPGSTLAPLVTTLHTVRVPAHLGRSAQLRVRGAWAVARDVDLEVVTPTGRTVPIDTFITRSRSSVGVGIRNRWIRADGTVRFRFSWHGHRPARMDKVVVRYWKLTWKRP